MRKSIGLIAAIILLFAITFGQGAQKETKQAVSDKWKELETASKMDDSPGMTLYIEAENTIEGWLQKSLPILTVRCKEGKIDLFIVTQMAAQPELGKNDVYTVRVRLDHNTPSTEEWTGSTSNKGLFTPMPEALIQQIRNSDMMLFEFTPFNADKVIAQFDVRGFSSHLKKLMEKCGKSEAPPALTVSSIKRGESQPKGGIQLLGDTKILESGCDVSFTLNSGEIMNGTITKRDPDGIYFTSSRSLQFVLFSNISSASSENCRGKVYSPSKTQRIEVADTPKAPTRYESTQPSLPANSASADESYPEGTIEHGNMGEIANKQYYYVDIGDLDIRDAVIRELRKESHITIGHIACSLIEQMAGG